MWGEVLEIIALEIPDVKLIRPKRLEDSRGFFSEVYSQIEFARAGIHLEFVQDNHSLSRLAGTVRGLHFQSPPYAQDKLVRVTKGRILDVAVDLRRESPTYGRHVAAEISDDNWTQILVPVGFAHGFCTLAAETEVLYKVSNVYSPENDAGIHWSDPDIGIEWPVKPDDAELSDKDSNLPRLKDIVSPF